MLDCFWGGAICLSSKPRMDTSPGKSADRVKRPVYKPLFLKWLFKFMAVSAVTIISIAPSDAAAGFLTDFLRFFAGQSSAGVVESSAGTISLPLLGSQASSVPADVDSGASEEKINTEEGLIMTQESALVGSRNPSGMLPMDKSFDTIFIYRVAAGDTPGSIAAQFRISLNTLMWANNLSRSSVIKPGDELIVLPVSGVKYEVRKGDTLETIAKKFRGDVEEIIAFNGRAIGESLSAGDVLIVPDGELASPAGVSVTARAPRLPEFIGYFLRPIIGGRRSRGLHGFNGIDLANSCGFPVVAAADGTVLLARVSGWNGGYGRYVVVAHPNNTQTLYAHLGAVGVSAGDRVGRGGNIGQIGSTGNSTGCHVHFEIRGAKNPF